MASSISKEGTAHIPLWLLWYTVNERRHCHRGFYTWTNTPPADLMFQTRDDTANDFSSVLFLDFLLCMPHVPGPPPLRWFWLGSSDVLWFLKEPRLEWWRTCARQRTRSPRLWALPDSPPQRRALLLTRSRPVQILQLRPRRLHPKVQRRVSDRPRQRNTLRRNPGL